MQVLPDTPAAEAGLSGGNVVQKIDGIPTDGKPPQQCVDLVRGPAGSQVKLELVDPTRNQTNTVELTRGMVQGTPPPLVFGFVYWKWRRLWPLFVAHMLFDVFAYIHEYHAA